MNFRYKMLDKAKKNFPDWEEIEYNPHYDPNSFENLANEAEYNAVRNDPEFIKLGVSGW